MKTLFVCSDRLINKHVGEEYDFIMEVPDQPTTDNISDWANRIRGRIRTLWMEQVKPEDPTAVVVNPKVLCFFDGPSPYNAILSNLQILMKAEEKIDIELPYMANFRQTVTDPETLEVLQKLDANKQQ